MQPGKYNFNAPQGSTFARTLIYKSNDVAVNLTGYSSRMQVRRNVNDTATLLSLSSPTDITIVGATGSITINVTASAMAAMPAGSFVYDLEITSSSGVVTRLIEGKFIVSPEVTR
jgi:hypothetical protein